MTPRVIAVLTVAVLALTGCSEGEAQDAVEQARDQVSTAVEDVELPKVDWKKYGTEAKQRLDRLAEQADCQGLKDELAEAEPNDTQLTRYIKAQLRRLSC
jgi:outer membrane murein-binding lipoprotein Lpp